MSVIVNFSRQHGKSTMLVLAADLVKKHKEIDRLKAEIKELKAVIRRHCKECWAFRGQDPAICRICSLRDFKDGKGIDVPADAPDTNVGTKGGE